MKEELEKVKSKKQKEASLKEKEVDNSNVAFQELYELTQRKFLKQLNHFCEEMPSSQSHPRLFCIDLVEKAKGNVKKTLLRKNTLNESVDNPSFRPLSASKDSIQSMDVCLRPMCEHEEGWHLSENYVLFTELTSKSGPYLARMMNILKNGSLANQLLVFQTEQGQKLMSDFEQSQGNVSLDESYRELRTTYIKKYENRTKVVNESGEVLEDSGKLDLKRCEMKNGKIMWLCKQHISATYARELADSQVSHSTGDSEINKKFLNDLETIQVDLV